jgi:hypothetical protein
VPDDVDEVVSLQPVGVRGALGVDHDHQAEPLDLRPERRKPRAGDLLALDVRADLDAAHAQRPGEVAQLLHRGGAVLQRHRAQRDEPPVVAGRGLRELLVDHPSGLGAQLGVGPVVVLEDGDGDGLDVHAHPIHVG